MFVLNSLGYVRLCATKHPVFFYNVCGNDSVSCYYSRQAAYTGIAYRRIKATTTIREVKQIGRIKG